MIWGHLCTNNVPGAALLYHALEIHALVKTLYLMMPFDLPPLMMSLHEAHRWMARGRYPPHDQESQTRLAMWGSCPSVEGLLNP